jgi:tetratricopeptide (TPR) repeat protein
MGERLGIARTLNHLGSLALARGEFGAARRCFDESLAIFEAHGDRPGIAGTLQTMGHLARAGNDYARAHALYARGYTIFHEMEGIGAFLGFWRLNQGGAAYVQGDHEAARAFFEDGLAALRKMDHRRHAKAWAQRLNEITQYDIQA